MQSEMRNANFAIRNGGCVKDILYVPGVEYERLPSRPSKGIFEVSQMKCRS